MKTRDDMTSRSGSLIIAVVLALLGASFLGAAILSTATSARYQRVHASGINRAYYLAESGGAYARALRMLDKDADPSGTFTLDNGDQFIVQRLSHSMTTLVFRSTGVAHPNTHIEARRQLTFDLSEQENDFLPVGFDFDNDGNFDDDMWNMQGLDSAKISSGTGPAGGQPALDLKGDQGQIYLNWQDKPELDLSRVWAFMGGLLSYDVQVKISPFEKGQGYSEHYMLGISFRLNPAIDHSYGISFFRSKLGTPPGGTPAWVPQLPQAFQDLRGTNIYLVLWFRDGAINTMDLINYRLLTSADPVSELYKGIPELSDYATMLLQLNEQFGTNNVLENLMTTYLQGSSVYPLWSTKSDVVWQEDKGVFPGPTVWHDGVITNRDNRLTSIDFAEIKPAEIGIHVFYDSTGANKKFFDDFAVRMEGYAAATATQIQY